MKEYILIDDCLPEEVKIQADAQGYLTEFVRCEDCKYCKIYGNGYNSYCTAGHNISYEEKCLIYYLDFRFLSLSD